MRKIVLTLLLLLVFTLFIAPALCQETAPIEYNWSVLNSVGYSAITALDDHLYSTNLNGLFTVFDVSDPTFAVMQGQWTGDFDENVQGIEAYGNFVYIIYDLYQINVLDVSDPLNPFCVDTLAVNGTIRCWHKSQGYLYTYDSWGEVHCWDMNTHELLGMLPLVNTLTSMAVANSHVFITSGNSDLRLLDFTDPSQPYVEKQVTFPGLEGFITAHEDILFCAIDTGGMQLYEVSDPANYSYLSTMPGVSTSTKMVFRDNQIIFIRYISFEPRTWLSFYDISDLSNPIQTNEEILNGEYGCIASLNDYLIMTTTYDPVMNIFSFSDFDHIVLTSTFFAGNLYSFAMTDAYIFVADSTRGIHVLDRESTPPVEVARFLVSDVVSINCHDDLLIVVFTTPGEDWYTWSHMRIYNVSDVHNPVLLSTTNLFGKGSKDKIKSVSVRNDLVFMSVGSEGLFVYDISQPAAPSLVARYTDVDYQKMAIYSDLACIFAHDGNQKILRFANISASGHMSVIEDIEWNEIAVPNSIYLDAEYAYVSNYEGFKIYDISHPSNPHYLYQQTEIAEAEQFYVKGNALIVLMSMSLRIYNKKDIMNLVLVGEIPYSDENPYSYKMIVEASNLFVLDGSSLNSYNISAPLALCQDTGDDVNPIISLSNHPNPFRSSTMLNIEALNAGEYLLDIYNIRGQKVRSISQSIPAPDSYSIPWDGRSDSGTQLSSGIYFLRASFQGHYQNHKLLLFH